MSSRGGRLYSANRVCCCNYIVSRWLLDSPMQSETVALALIVKKGQYKCLVRNWQWGNGGALHQRFARGNEVLAVLEVLEVLEVLAASDEDIRPPSGRDKRDLPAGPFPDPYCRGKTFPTGVRKYAFLLNL